MPNNQDSISLTIWGDNAESKHHVLLIPGWTGGPLDVLGIANYLSEHNTTVYVLTPKGWHNLPGEYSFFGALDDFKIAYDWINKIKALNSKSVVVGGYSWGGGMSLAFAAQNKDIERTFSLAGTDHGRFIRQYMDDPEFAKMIENILNSSSAPEGPIVFDVQEGLTEMMENQNVFGLMENAKGLSEKDLFIAGGWNDMNVSIDQYLLPLFRKIQANGGEKITFKTYHDDHSFLNERKILHQDLLNWINKD